MDQNSASWTRAPDGRDVLDGIRLASSGRLGRSQTRYPLLSFPKPSSDRSMGAERARPDECERQAAVLRSRVSNEHEHGSVPSSSGFEGVASRSDDGTAPHWRASRGRLLMLRESSVRRRLEGRRRVCRHCNRPNSRTSRRFDQLDCAECRSDPASSRCDRLVHRACSRHPLAVASASLGISLRSATEPIDDTSTGKLVKVCWLHSRSSTTTCARIERGRA